MEHSTYLISSVFSIGSFLILLIGIQARSFPTQDYGRIKALGKPNSAIVSRIDIQHNMSINGGNLCLIKREKFLFFLRAFAKAIL